MGSVMTQLGSTMTGFDASDACMRVEHTGLDELMEDADAGEHDHQLMHDRHNGAVIVLKYGPKDGPIVIKPGCGFLQGDVTGPWGAQRQIRCEGHTVGRGDACQG